MYFSLTHRKFHIVFLNVISLLKSGVFFQAKEAAGPLWSLHPYSPYIFSFTPFDVTPLWLYLKKNDDILLLLKIWSNK